MDAQRKQTLIVVIIFSIFIAMAGVAVWYSSRFDDGASGGTAGRFTARAGKERSAAVPLRRSGQEQGGGGGSGGGSGVYIGTGDDESPDHMRIIKPSTQNTINEAREMLDPNEGIAQLQRELETFGEGEAPAELHTALGLLHARQDPPDMERAATAFDAGERAARTPEQHYAVALGRVEALDAAGQSNDALDLATRFMESNPQEVPPLSALQLGVARAALLEKEGRIEEATASYRATLNAAMATMDAGREAAADPFRVAGLRLYRLYQAQGEENRAQAVARLVRERLSAF